MRGQQRILWHIVREKLLLSNHCEDNSELWIAHLHFAPFIGSITGAPISTYLIADCGSVRDLLADGTVSERHILLDLRLTVLGNDVVW